MNVIDKIFEFIQRNPGASARDLARAFPQHHHTTVQRAAYRLYECELTTRKRIKSEYCYFVTKGAELSDVPTSNSCKLADLFLTAQNLESKSLWRRAATVWTEAYALAKMPNDRDHCLKRRAYCMRAAPRAPKAEAVCNLNGRFEGAL